MGSCSVADRIEIGAGEGSGIQIYVAHPGDTVLMTMPRDAMPDGQKQALLDWCSEREVAIAIIEVPQP